MMVLLELFISFLKIGFTSFGGLDDPADHLGDDRPRLDDRLGGFRHCGDCGDDARPLGLNCATFAGMRTAGLLGAIAANLGTLSPTLTVCLLAAIFFEALPARAA